MISRITELILIKDFLLILLGFVIGVVFRKAV